MRNAKIICTIGPASDAPAVLSRLASGGMDVARLNFSHGSTSEHELRIRRIRAIRSRVGPDVKILQDLEGYRIRIGKFHGKAFIVLRAGQTVFLTNDPARAGSGAIFFDYEGPLTAIRPGSRLFIDDGNLMLVVRSAARRTLKAQTVVPGVLKEHKGVNIPGFNPPFCGLTPKDEQDLRFGVDKKVDFIAQSFVRSRQDVTALRDKIGSPKGGPKIVAKIENRLGLRNFDEILEAADGIMVARGDLGVSVPIYQVPIIQKEIIRRCRAKKKFVITATQMLESMTQNLRPTRAEVSDVANAVLDGSDFVMLSAETAVGRHPAAVVEMMDKIIRYTEEAWRRKGPVSLKRRRS